MAQSCPSAQASHRNQVVPCREGGIYSHTSGNRGVQMGEGTAQIKGWGVCVMGISKGLRMGLLGGMARRQPGRGQVGGPAGWAPGPQVCTIRFAIKLQSSVGRGRGGRELHILGKVIYWYMFGEEEVVLCRSVIGLLFILKRNFKQENLCREKEQREREGL